MMNLNPDDFKDKKKLPDFSVVFEELKESDYLTFLEEELIATVTENEEYREFFSTFPEGFAGQVANELPAAFVRDGP
jgi:uncharacterized protein YpbB